MAVVVVVEASSTSWPRDWTDLVFLSPTTTTTRRVVVVVEMTSMTLPRRIPNRIGRMRSRKNPTSNRDTNDRRSRERPEGKAGRGRVKPDGRNSSSRGKRRKKRRRSGKERRFLRSRKRTVPMMMMMPSRRRRRIFSCSRTWTN